MGTTALDTPACSDTNGSTPIRYWIDESDTIVRVAGPWDVFASVNGSTSLSPEQVIGRSLWDFVLDDTTRDLYRLLFQHARDTCRAVVFPYRCDSPTLRRFMQMTLEPDDRGGLSFLSETLRVEKRKTSLVFSFQRGARPMTFRCSFCNAMRVRGRWADVADAVAVGLVLNHDLPVAVAYGVCDGCRSDVRQRLRPASTAGC